MSVELLKKYIISRAIKVCYKSTKLKSHLSELYCTCYVFKYFFEYLDSSFIKII